MAEVVVMPLQVTLHNSALFNMDSEPTGGFRKLSHLLQSPPFPPQTFCNILMLYCKPQHAFYDLAADVMADNADLVATNLSKVCLTAQAMAVLSAVAPHVSCDKSELAQGCSNVQRNARLPHLNKARLDTQIAHAC